MERLGYMQAGGGRVSVAIEPAAESVGALTQLEALEPGEFLGAEAAIYLHNLDESIREREAGVLLDSAKYASLGLEPDTIRPAFECSRRGGPEGPGNAVLVKVRRASGLTVCSEIGWAGRSAEVVAGQAAQRAVVFLHSHVPVEQRLADQLLVPLALAGGGRFMTEKPSRHALTCMDLLPLFLDVRTEVSQLDKKRYLVEVLKSEGDK